MKELFISMNRNVTVDKFLSQNDPSFDKNGKYRLDVFPTMIQATRLGSSAKEAYPVRLVFVQEGNSYGPDFDYSQISTFQVEELFNFEEELDFDYNQTKARARQYYAESNDLDVDEVEERYLDDEFEFQEELEAIQEEWLNQHYDYNREVAFSSLRKELVDENTGITYRIVWGD